MRKHRSIALSHLPNWSGKYKALDTRARDSCQGVDKERSRHASRDEIVLELKRIAFFDIRKLFDPETGKLITDPTKMDEDDVRGLASFDVVVLDKGGNYIVKLNPASKLKALELLVKHLGILSDRLDVTQTRHVIFSTDFGEDDSPKEPPERSACDRSINMLVDDAPR